MPSQKDGFRVLFGPIATPGDTGVNHEMGTQKSRTTMGATSLEERGGWIHVITDTVKKSFRPPHKLPLLPVGSDRDARIAIPASSFPYQSPVGYGLNTGESSVVNIVNVPFIPRGISPFSDSRDNEGKKGCGCK